MKASDTFRSALALYSLAIGDAFAQVDRTGTGGGPHSAVKAPYTTAVGQTKPPSGGAHPTSVTPHDGTKSGRSADAAFRRICVGCVTEPSKTGASYAKGSLDLPQGRRNVQLDELRKGAEPKKQTDLDTVALASAHREQAKSIEEKTNGLWQSWLVSVCDGCGDQKPAKVLRQEDMPLRNPPSVTGSVGESPTRGNVRFDAARQTEPRPHGSLAADLSPENVGSIRHMPRE